MNWKAWVGFRYLKSKKNSKFLSYITYFSVLGVGVGVLSMIVVLSVMDGFEDQLKRRLMSSDVHVQILPKAGSDFGDVEAVSKAAKNEAGVTSVWEILSTDAILKTERKDKRLFQATGILLKGVSPERLKKLDIVERSETQALYETEGPNTSRLPGVLIGQELGYSMGIIPGDRVLLVSPTETEGALSAVPRMKRFVVEAIYHNGMPEQELAQAYLMTDDLRAFLRRQAKPNNIELTVAPFEQASSVATHLRGQFPELKIQDWEQMNSTLFFSLKLERVAMFVALAFIVLVASFNIVTTLTLMVLEKRKEISILRAMGATSRDVKSIFMLEGMMIGLVGILSGISLGAGICFSLRRYQFIKLPDVYYDRTLPVSFELSYYLGVISIALVIVLFACWIPGRRASKIGILEGIRLG